MKIQYARVTAHCVIRYLERILKIEVGGYHRETAHITCKKKRTAAMYKLMYDDGMPLDDIIRTIQEATLSAFEHGLPYAIADGVEYKLQGGTVISAVVHSPKFVCKPASVIRNDRIRKVQSRR